MDRQCARLGKGQLAYVEGDCRNARAFDSHQPRVSAKRVSDRWGKLDHGRLVGWKRVGVIRVRGPEPSPGRIGLTRTSEGQSGGNAVDERSANHGKIV